ncbi:MAG TPA: SRPBCC family protein [Hyalangium sp.]|nr:SRPBCC family protein [Hyalangium sp.]
MLKKILIVVAVAIIGLVGLISTQPDALIVQRSATIQAPADIVFAKVNDFHKWSEWSPWEKLDPNMKRTFTGANAGLDAMYEWTGNDEVGKGRMTIQESKPNELVRIRLEFFEPWPQTSTTLFTFAPAGEGTTVTWKMEGKHNFVSKAMCLVMDMDKLIGKDFEAGLASMKNAAEAEAKALAEKAAADAAAAPPAAAAPAEGQPANGTAAAPAP